MQQQITLEQEEKQSQLLSVVRRQADEGTEIAFLGALDKAKNASNLVRHSSYLDVQKEFTPHFLFRCSAFAILTFFILTLLNSLIANFGIKLDNIIVFSLIFLISIASYLYPILNYLSLFFKESRKLLPYHDIRSVGVLTKLAALTYSPQQQADVLAALQPLLESLTPSDTPYFHEIHRKVYGS